MAVPRPDGSVHGQVVRGQTLASREGQHAERETGLPGEPAGGLEMTWNSLTSTAGHRFAVFLEAHLYGHQIIG